MPSSDVRSSETSAQNARGKKFPKSSRVQIFAVLIFAFWSRVENLDLAKISRYTVPTFIELEVQLDTKKMKVDCCFFFHQRKLAF